MKKSFYGEVIVNNKTKATDQLFTYSIPKKFLDKAKIGSKVIVPFGKKNILLEGYILNISNHTKYKGIKAIKYIFDEYFRLIDDQIKLCKCIRNIYLFTYFDAIQCIIPPGTKLRKKYIYFLNQDADVNELNELTAVEKNIIKALRDFGTLTKEELTKILKIRFNNELEILIQKNIINCDENFYFPASIKYKKIIKLNIRKEEFDKEIRNSLTRAPKQIEVLETLLESKDKEIELNKLLDKIQTSLSVIKSLEKKGLILIYKIEDYRSPINDSINQENNLITFNDEQAKIYRELRESIYKNQYKAFLLHGITGSGKTEIYIELVNNILKLKKQAIILVPEISLTTQLVSKFVKRFGHNVAVLHSKLSIGERYDQWRKIKNNDISIVIGARSAIFAPCKRLGLIIIDEEHESSYKSEMHPKYHTKDVAEFRCKKSNSTLLLGSATPSIESYYNAEKNVYNLLKIEKRFNNNPLPSVEIIDMRKELEKGNRSIFSKNLYDSMKETLSNNKQVILFLNRRGYSTFISCRSCGFVIKCKNCDISLTYHQSSDIVKCHYCGYKLRVPVRCPKCSSKYIKHFGTGTEKIETLVKKIFPYYVTQRLDIDTTSKKGDLERIIHSFEQRKIDILIGTQMVAKGLDFPYVTLVGVLSADTSLNLPDFRSNERTFQLLTQVAGRAGRHKFAGKVVIQTYTPDNYSIRASQSHDYNLFYKKEIILRKEFLYPPFCEMVNIILLGEKEDDVIKSAHSVYYQLQTYIKKRIKNKIELLGPSPAIYNKIKGSYRWQILIKYQSVDQEDIKGIINNICDTNKNKIIPSNVNINFDINPYNIF